MISNVIIGLCALVMYGVGIVQFRSEKPVAFYSGETPPSVDELKDVKAWNKKHGIMWILYGVIITIGLGVGMAMGDSVWVSLVVFVTICVPIIFLPLYHKKLIKDYVVKKD